MDTQQQQQQHHSKLSASSPTSSTARTGPEPDLDEPALVTAIAEDTCTLWEEQGQEEQEADLSSSSLRAVIERTCSQKTLKRAQDTDDQDLTSSLFEPVKKCQGSSRSSTHTPSPSQLLSSQVTLGFVPCPPDDEDEGLDSSGGDFSNSQGIHELDMQHSSPMMPRLYEPLGRQDEEEFGQERGHSHGGNSDGQNTVGEDSSVQQQHYNLDGGDGASTRSHMAMMSLSPYSSAAVGHVTMSGTARSYSSLALLDEGEHSHSPHVSVQHLTVLSSPGGGQVKSVEGCAGSISDSLPVQGLTLLSDDEFNPGGGRVEGEEPTYVIVSTQPTGETDVVLSSETWTHSAQAPTYPSDMVSYNHSTYQQNVQQHQQQQQPPFGTYIQQSQPQSNQTSLPGIKEISGFYPSVPLPEQSSMTDRTHYQIGPQGVHSQFMGVYASANYVAPGMGSLPFSHTYPVPVGFREIPLPKRRRDRRSAGNSRQPHGAASRYDASRHQPGFKVEDPTDRNELLESSSLTVQSESFKHEHAGGSAFDGQVALSCRRQEVLERDPDPKACNNCQTTSTPSWRRCPKGRILLCNACGLYQKLHGKSRPHYMAKDGTIKIQRTIPEHAPCVHCNTRNSPTWKKGSHGEAICHPCSTAMKPSRLQSKSKVPRIEYPGSAQSVPADMGGVVGIYAGDVSGAEYSEAMWMRGSHAHGLGTGAGEGSYGDFENIHLQSRSHQSSSSRYSTKATQQGHIVDNYSSRQGANQYSGGRSIVYGYSQVTPSCGLAQYGGYDASGYSLASLHTYPPSPAGWQPDVAAYGSGAYSGVFAFESSPPQQGQSPQRAGVGMFRADSSSSSAIPVVSQLSPEGQQLLVPYSRSSQASYLAWEHAQQSRLAQSSLHSVAWGGTNGGAIGSGGHTAGMSSEMPFSQDHHQQQQQPQHRVLLFNQRSTPASSSLAGFSTSNETLRPDRHQGLQQHKQHSHLDSPFAHHHSLHIQQQHAQHQYQQHGQQHQHAYRSGSSCGQQQQQQHYQPYPDATSTSTSTSSVIQNRSHSPNQEQRNQDYEAALQSYVQGGGGGGGEEEGGSGDTSMVTPAHSAGTSGLAAEVSGCDVQDQQQVVGAVTLAPPSRSDLGTQTEVLGQASPGGGRIKAGIGGASGGEDKDEGKSSSNLEAMAAETLASTFFDRQNNVTAPSPAPESSLVSSRAATVATVPTIVVSEHKKLKKSGDLAVMMGVEEENKPSPSSALLSASHKQHEQQHGSIASLASAGRSASAPVPVSVLMHSAIPGETGTGHGHRPRRSERHRTTSTSTSMSVSAAAAAAASADVAGDVPKPAKRQEGLMSQHLSRRQ